MRRHPELTYPELDDWLNQERLAKYKAAAERSTSFARYVLQGLPEVYHRIVPGLMSASLIIEETDNPSRLPLAVVRCQFDRGDIDGLMVLSDLDEQEEHSGWFSPFPVVLINERIVKDSTTVLVLLRHEGVHVEQVIRGDYFCFFRNEERKVIARDALGSYTKELRAAGAWENLQDLASRRLLQDVYNEGEAYSREILDHGHRVNFWEAWKGILLIAADYYFRYFLSEKMTLAQWVACFEGELRRVCKMGILYKTQYSERGAIRFLDLFIRSISSATSVTFRTGSADIRDLTVMVPKQAVT